MGINSFLTPQKDSIFPLCKLQNYIYLLTCAHCGMKYVAESIPLLNLRMNIHRKGKSGYQDVIFLLIIIQIFSKLEHFQSKALKSYQEMVMKNKK